MPDDVSGTRQARSDIQNPALSKLGDRIESLG